MASLLYRLPTQSETIGRLRAPWERGHVIQWCSWTSRWADFICAVLGPWAASRTSSRRVGMLIPV